MKTIPSISDSPVISFQNEERNRLQALKELQKKVISSQAYCFSPLKKCATLDCCEKLEKIVGNGYFLALKSLEEDKNIS